jgi:hypothetical protein
MRRLRIDRPMVKVAAFTLLTLGYLGLGLYPFRWSPLGWDRNTAEMTSEGRLVFRSFGLARAGNVTELIRSAIAQNEIDIHLVVRSFAGRKPPRGTILAITHDSYLGNLVIGQSADDLHVYVRAANETTERELDVQMAGVFPDHEQFADLRVTLQPGRLRIVHNGVERFSTELARHALRDWYPSFPLTLGNQRGGNSPWLGEILVAEITAGGRSLDLLAPSQLEIPDSYWRFAIWPKWIPFYPLRVQDNMLDLAINLFGFTPYGFAIALLLGRGRHGLWTIAAAVGLSATIELAQLGLAQRFCSSTDFVLNVTGSGLGIGVARVAERWWRRRRGRDEPDRIAVDRPAD